MAAGVVLVALDFRIVAADVLPDPVGWLLVAAGAWKLALGLPALLGAAAALGSLPDVLAPHHYEATSPFAQRWFPAIHALSDPVPGLRYEDRLEFDRLHGGRLVLAVLAIVAGGLALWSILGTLRERAGALGDRESAGRLALLRWLVPCLWVAPYVGVAIVQGSGDQGFDPVWNGGLEAPALLGLAVAASVAWALVINSNRAWTATDEERVTPWAETMVDGR
jgi:hypothetical protein